MMKKYTVLLTLLLTAVTAQASIIIVPTDFSSIQTAVDSAGFADTVLVKDGQYYERIIIHKKTVTIASEYILDSDSSHILNTIIDADTSVSPASDTGSAIIIDSTISGEVQIIGITIQNGIGSKYLVFGNLFTVGGGLLCAEAHVLISNCIVKNNRTTNFGGGIFSLFTPLRLINSEIKDNLCLNDGGGLCLFSSSGSIVDTCAFINNTGKDGAGAYIPFGDATVSNSLFESNDGLLGGGIYLEDNETPITNCNFYDNTAFQGGGVYTKQVVDGEITNCIFINNSAFFSQAVDGLGGALCFVASQMLVTNCTLYLNSSDQGAGIYASGSSQFQFIYGIISHSPKGSAVGCAGSSSPYIFCSNIFGNVDGNYSGCINGWDFPKENTELDPMYCLNDTRDVSLKDISPCLAANNVCLLLIGANGMGCIATDINEGDLNLPNEFQLMQNYPNPFNPSTIIKYSVPERSEVRIFVTNLLGQHVTTLVDELKSGGRYETAWNGRDQYGNQISSGVYFYTIKAGDFTESRKMILAR